MTYRNRDEWDRLIQKQQTGDLSIIDFCKQLGVHHNTFYKQRQRFEANQCTVSEFIEIPRTIVKNKEYSSLCIKIGKIEIFPNSLADGKQLKIIIQTVLEASSASL